MAEERNMVNLTLTVSREERKALKQLALDKDTTVSALLRMWMKEHMEEENTSRDQMLFFIMPVLFSTENSENHLLHVKKMMTYTRNRIKTGKVTENEDYFIIQWRRRT